MGPNKVGPTGQYGGADTSLSLRNQHLKAWGRSRRNQVCLQLKGCDLIRVTETWWDSRHSWSAAMDGYRLFRKDSDGEELPFEVRAAGMHELCLRMDEEPAESQVTVVVAVCYRAPVQKKRQVESSDKQSRRSLDYCFTEISTYSCQFPFFQCPPLKIDTDNNLIVGCRTYQFLKRL